MKNIELSVNERIEYEKLLKAKEHRNDVSKQYYKDNKEYRLEYLYKYYQKIENLLILIADNIIKIIKMPILNM